MAFERPSLTDIVDRVQSDFESRLSLVGAVLRRSVVYVFARVIAGSSHMLHGHLDYLGRQLFPDQSDEAYLLRQAAVFGLTKTAATYATGTTIFYGTNATVVPDGSVLTRSDGAEYETDSDATIATLTAWANTTGYTAGTLRRNSGNIYLSITAGISAGSGGPTTTAADITDGTVHWMYIAAGSAAVTAAVTATEAGADSTLSQAEVLTFESPIAGATSTSTVADTTVDGSDEETTEALRTRLLERMADRPAGGTEADYVAWAKEVSGVTRVWVYPLQLGVGTVAIYFVRDDDASAIPSAGEVTDVQNYIDTVRPVTADVTVYAPTAVPLNFTLEISPDTTATRAAVEAELEDLILRDAEPGGTILLSQILTAIGNAEGVEDFTLASPAADVTRTTGQLTTLGTVTFT